MGSGETMWRKLVGELNSVATGYYKISNAERPVEPCGIDFELQYDKLRTSDRGGSIAPVSRKGSVRAVEMKISLREHATQ